MCKMKVKFKKNISFGIVIFVGFCFFSSPADAKRRVKEKQSQYDESKKEYQTYEDNKTGNILGLQELRENSKKYGEQVQRQMQEVRRKMEDLKARNGDAQRKLKQMSEDAARNRDRIKQQIRDNKAQQEQQMRMLRDRLKDYERNKR